MSEESDQEYGQRMKKIVFYDTDKRHVDLKIRLQHDKLKQAEFFRLIVTGYLERDKDILSYVHRYLESESKMSKKNLSKNKELINDGKEKESVFALNEDEIENIFDLLEEQYPDL